MPLKACIVCGTLSPTNRCANHTRKPWQGNRQTISGRRLQARNRRILQAHDHICHVCNQPGADQVDHVIPLAEGGADKDWNLRPIHAHPCHATKTQAEAARGRRRNQT